MSDYPPLPDVASSSMVVRTNSNSVSQRDDSPSDPSASAVPLPVTGDKGNVVGSRDSDQSLPLVVTREISRFGESTTLPPRLSTSSVSLDDSTTTGTSLPAAPPVSLGLTPSVSLSVPTTAHVQVSMNPSSQYLAQPIGNRLNTMLGSNSNSSSTSSSVVGMTFPARSNLPTPSPVSVGSVSSSSASSGMTGTGTKTTTTMSMTTNKSTSLGVSQSVDARESVTISPVIRNPLAGVSRTSTLNEGSPRTSDSNFSISSSHLGKQIRSERTSGDLSHESIPTSRALSAPTSSSLVSKSTLFTPLGISSTPRPLESRASQVNKNEPGAQKDCFEYLPSSLFHDEKDVGDSGFDSNALRIQSTGHGRGMDVVSMTKSKPDESPHAILLQRMQEILDKEYDLQVQEAKSYQIFDSQAQANFLHRFDRELPPPPVKLSLSSDVPDYVRRALDEYILSFLAETIALAEHRVDVFGWYFRRRGRMRVKKKRSSLSMLIESLPLSMRAFRRRKVEVDEAVHSNPEEEELNAIVELERKRRIDTLLDFLEGDDLMVANSSTLDDENNRDERSPRSGDPVSDKEDSNLNEIAGPCEEALNEDGNDIPQVVITLDDFTRVLELHRHLGSKHIRVKLALRAAQEYSQHSFTTSQELESSDVDGAASGHVPTTSAGHNHMDVDGSGEHGRTSTSEISSFEAIGAYSFCSLLDLPRKSSVSDATSSVNAFHGISDSAGQKQGRTRNHNSSK